LFQLKYESAFDTHELSMNFRVSLSEEKDIVVPKSPTIMQELYRFTGVANEAKYLTPTALNAYLECPLRFYFRYVAHIQEKEDVTEDIEGSMFGKLLHNTMERVYGPYLRKEMNASDFEKLIADNDSIEIAILKAFATEFFKKEGEIPELHGKSLVVKEILKKYVLQILEFDKTLAPITLVDFEKTFQYVMNIDVDSKSLPVIIGGKIDRIDKTNNTFRVIDYKTGKVDYKFDSIGQLFEVSGKKQNKEVLQILLYSFILGQDKEFKHLPIVPGLYGLRDIFKHDFNCQLIEGKSTLVEHFAPYSEPYITGLRGVLEEIFNPSAVFNKTEDKKACEYCDYKDICHR
jgi:ATP-dependent exoDNAse (exonuclease V) beta subunit